MMNNRKIKKNRWTIHVKGKRKFHGSHTVATEFSTPSIRHSWNIFS